MARGGSEPESVHVDDMVDPVPGIPNVPSDWPVEIVGYLRGLKSAMRESSRRGARASGRRWCSYDLYRFLACWETTVVVFVVGRVRLISELAERVEGHGRPDIDEDVAESDDREAVGSS
jgi:hypothetical protein